MEYLAQMITIMRSEEGEPVELLPADAEPLLRADDLANSYSSPSAAGAQQDTTQSWFSYIGCVLGLIAEPAAEDWVIDYNSITHIKWLGSGANGAVFLGAHAGKAVAVKKLEHSEQLKREVNHLRGLCHPNIIKLLGICVQPSTCAVVMEFCPESLTDAIHKHDDAIIPPTTVVDWSTQIARGMEYLHSMNIIHRDLKVSSAKCTPSIAVNIPQPANVLKSGPVLKITDFGTSREYKGRSTHMSFAGTAAYMAPEVVRNEPYSEKGMRACC